MKKLAIIIALIVLPRTLDAQIVVEQIIHDADTLIYLSKTGMEESEFIDIYKNSKGYFIAVHSTNMFDNDQKLYIGRTKDEAIKSLEYFMNICDNDVATSVIFKDSEGSTFIGKTAHMAKHHRRLNYVKSDRVYISNNAMAGVMCIRVQGLTEAIKFLNM